MPVNITYNGAALAAVDDGQIATINCAGKKMEGNVVVDVPSTSFTELVKGSILVTDTKNIGSTYPFGFIVGMNWTLFLETVGDASGAFGYSGDYVLVFGYPISYNGVPVLVTDLVIDSATYTN